MTPAHPSPTHPDEPSRGPADHRSSGPPSDETIRPPEPRPPEPRRAYGVTPGPLLGDLDEADDPDNVGDLADLDRLDALSGRHDLADMLGTEPPPEVVVRLRGGDELVAALPVLLGFHPVESLVLVGFGGRTTQRVGLTVRVDLPFPDDLDDVCAQAVSALVTDSPAGAVAVVVGGTAADAGGPPRRDVAVTVSDMLVEAGVEPFAVLWAAGTAPGRPWACYDLPGQDCGCRGEVPDPAATAVAAAAARRGYAVLPDRAAVGRILAADAPDAIGRRARLRARELDLAASAPDGPPEPDRNAEHRLLLRRAIADAAACRLAVDDATVLRFCAAFDSPEIRQAAVRACLGLDSAAAEQLWAALSRAMPPPERAEPAALFAVCALLRGDGALASMAVERAVEAFPGHRLAGTVAAALRDFTGPTGLRRSLERTYG